MRKRICIAICLLLSACFCTQNGLAEALSPEAINGQLGCVTVALAEPIEIPGSPAIFDASIHHSSVEECMARWNVGEPERETNCYLNDGWLWDMPLGRLKLDDGYFKIFIGMDDDYPTAIKAQTVVGSGAYPMNEFTYDFFDNIEPLSSMSYEEAAQTIETATQLLMTDSWNAFATAEVEVRPLHAEDLQAGRDALLADEYFGESWVSPVWNEEIVDTSHYGEADECYHAVVRFSIDGIPVLPDSYYYEYNDSTIIGAYGEGYVNSEKILYLNTSQAYDLTLFKRPTASVIEPAKVIHQLCTFLNMLLYEETYAITEMEMMYYPIPQRGHRFQFRPAWRICLNFTGDLFLDMGIDDYSENLFFDAYTGEILAGL